jgi:hypothetical protein
MASPSRSSLPIPRLLSRARAAASDLAQAIRRSDRFLKMRAAVVGTWALLSLITLWSACPSSGPTNSLGADVQVLRESLVGGEQLLVRNESAGLWTDVVLTLDEGWRYEHKTVRPHDQLVLSMTQFRREGESAPLDYKPRALTIECDQGRFTTSIEPR